MICIYDYYRKNIKEDSFYYFTFNSDIESYFIFNDDYKYFDEKQLINRFRLLTYPKTDYSENENMEFILICFYLNNQGYYIEQFPNFLERPTNVESFSLEMREYILSYENNNGVVSWAKRRLLSNSLIFNRNDISNISITEDLNELFKKISNRNADFIAMTNNEKLGEINNVIENILKINDKWKDIDYQIETFGFLSNDIVMQYRKLIHCFRHGTENSIEERNTFTDQQKDFLINYGITICELVLNVIKNKKVGKGAN